MRKFSICTAHQIFFGVIKLSMIWALHMVRTGKAEVHTGMVGETWGKEATLKTGIDGRIILKLISKKSVGRSWTGFMWLKIGTTGGLLRGISWLCEELLASEESLCSMLYWLHLPQMSNAMSTHGPLSRQLLFGICCHHDTQHCLTVPQYHVSRSIFGCSGIRFWPLLSDRQTLMNCKRCISVKNTFGRSTVVSSEGELVVS